MNQRLWRKPNFYDRVSRKIYSITNLTGVASGSCIGPTKTGYIIGLEFTMPIVRIATMVEEAMMPQIAKRVDGSVLLRNILKLW